MYPHLETKLLYLAHPRTASTATARALKEIGFQNTPQHHGRLSLAVEKFQMKNPNEWTVFSTVRNPFDVFVGWYFNDNHYPERDLDADLIDHIVSNTRYLEPNNMWFHAENCTDIMRYEQLDYDLNQILEPHGFRYVIVPRINVTKERGGRPYEMFFKSSGVDRVYELFGEELEEYGYDY